MWHETYKTLLCNYAFLNLRNYSEDTLFPQDGPIRNSPFNCVSLDQKYTKTLDGECWIQINASSLTGFGALGLRLVGYLKYVEYCYPLNKTSGLKTRTSQKATSIDEDNLKKGYKDMNNRSCFAFREGWSFQASSKLKRTYFYWDQYASLSTGHN